MAACNNRDHGGNLDAAVARFGGNRDDWLDLSTGINPCPYPIPKIPASAWNGLPDSAMNQSLVTAAREFWQVPDTAAVLPVPGASSAIAQIPRLAPPDRVFIPTPTYNEHAASFAAYGWQLSDSPQAASACIHVHPNNPDGRFWKAAEITGQLRIIDESFCDVATDATLISLSAQPRTLVLKSFGKFWGLAGLRLGFIVGDPDLLEQLAEMLGPWPVSGPALTIGSQALRDSAWANETRKRLATDATRLDDLMNAAGADTVGGTTLFRLYDVEDATLWQHRLARHHVWSRVFPYNPRWLRLGLPGPDAWPRLEQALA